MKLVLEKKPKNATIIEGFPGFGLIGTIATEYLIKHLDAEPIGKIRLDEVPPVIAVHQGRAIEPLGVYYSKKYNLIIMHALSSVNGLEWEISELIMSLAKEIKAKEIISLEGVGSNTELEESRVFYIGDNKKLKTIGIESLKEGIIVGVTGALLLKEGLNITCLFAETHSALPDSRAAAKIIEILDKYLGLKIDYKPLLEKAEKFETKLRDIMMKSKDALATKAKKEPTYIG